MQKFYRKLRLFINEVNFEKIAENKIAAKNYEFFEGENKF